MIQRQATCSAEDGHATIVHLYLSCVRAKTSVGVVKKWHCNVTEIWTILT